MTAPKKRTTKSRRDKRRLHIFLKEPSLVKCKKCGKLILPHRACPFCGYYKGRRVLNISKDKDKKETKKEKRGKEKEGKEKKKEPLNLKKLSKK